MSIKCVIKIATDMTGAQMNVHTANGPCVAPWGDMARGNRWGMIEGLTDEYDPLPRMSPNSKSSGLMGAGVPLAL